MLNKSNIMIVLLLLILAGTLRFYKLGDWPFAHDETSTLVEDASLFHGLELAPEKQHYRLPRIIPLSYFVFHIGETLFGRDEFGSRVIIAILGTLSVGLTFLLLDGLRGRPTAIATALLITFWPEHLFRSQETRFYIIVSFFMLLCFLCGAITVQRRSLLAAIGASCFALAAILSHTLMALVFGILIVGTAAGAFAERQPIPKRIIGVYLTAGLIATGFYLIYLAPLMQGWNPKSTWAYSPIHSMFASVNMLGWPVALLAVLGLLLLANHRTSQNWYWLMCGLSWGALTLILPYLVAYHPEYIFPFAFSMVVIAGCTIGTIFDYLQKKSVVIGVVWVAITCLMNLPGVASHYVDGTRYDVRTAAHFISNHWEPGDRVAAQPTKIFSHYAPRLTPTIGLSASRPIKHLKEITDNQGRIWIVLHSYRSGIPEDLRSWLYENCVHKLTVGHRRFDYHAHHVDVFLWDPIKSKN